MGLEVVALEDRSPEPELQRGACWEWEEWEGEMRKGPGVHALRVTPPAGRKEDGGF